MDVQNVLKSKFSSAEIKLFLILIECSLFFLFE